MQQKSEPTDLPNEVIEFVGRPVWQNKNKLETLIPINPFNRFIVRYNWYEKAMLGMIRAKGFECNLYALCSVFYVIREYQLPNEDMGEIIYIIDQFARRLETIDKSKNTIEEIALISAIVGMKAASDLAVWSIDFIYIYNNFCISYSKCETISLDQINELERQHLLVLNYVLGFSKISNMDERLRIIMSFLDLKGMQTIENEMQQLKLSGEGLKLGSHIQKAIFKKTSETNPGFFRKGSKKSKTDNDIVPSEKTITVNSNDGFRCQSSGF
ncbi:MAG: hypothetical protein H0U73_06890 [Tatlockia sp.]|nr:hypothetical protein [Tatlockia sp.]